MISKKQMMMHDYDWFCIINNKPVCVCSAGSPIPDVINQNRNVINTMGRVGRLPMDCQFELNIAYLRDHICTSGFEYLQDPIHCTVKY